MTKSEFIESIAGFVLKYARTYGIETHSPVIAQAILESGWGESILAAKYHNYFGLKCGTKWTGKSVNLKTREEYTPGTLTTITDNFRVFDSIEEGVKGYFEFIQLPRYRNLKGIRDPRKYLETIRADGYATSSTYVENNMRLIVQYGLTKYDGTEEGTVLKTRSAIANLARSWIGKKESDGTHRSIIDIYNSYLPHPRGYKLQYSDAWCAGTVSALAVKLGYTDLIPIECSCYYMMEAAKRKGIWQENDAYKPQIGDLVLYDWGDSGAGDNTGSPDHVGIVTAVTGKGFTVIEGNKNNAVGTRSMSVNGRYIRGFICPKYDEETREKTEEKEESRKEDTSGGINRKPLWVGRVIAGALNVRSWAGTEYGNIKSRPVLYKGNLVDVCDSLKAADKSKWYYIRIDGRIYGFVSAKYIEKE